MNNVKDLVIAVGLTLLTALAIRYFFLDKYWGQLNDSAQEQSFIARKVQQENKPLNLEVDFLDTKSSEKPTVTSIQAEWGNVQFSTDAASLESIEFKHPVSDKESIIRTIFPVAATERENRCFLIGLEKETPYYYQLINRKDSEESVQLTYETKFSGNVITKKFIVYKKKHKIDLILEVLPKKGSVNGLKPRIFYPSPIMPEIIETDIISSVLVDSSGTFKTTNRSKLNVQQGWFKPTLFGAENRYFVHSLVEDTDSFAQRAYYKLEGHEKIFSILEGPKVEVLTTWMLSFYFGPKKVDAIAAVDGRLEKTLAYSGLFAPISKLLLYILKWLYTYLHNYGLAIIALTCIVRLILLPFTMHGSQKMSQQREFQGKLAYIQRKYKQDPERLTQERDLLIRKHGMPGLGGCLLPLLLQMPIFFALSRVLSNSIELYDAPMLWISDLSTKDPYYILPILVGASLLVQSMQGDAQQRTSGLIMALIFGVIAINFTAGLALYICISTLLSVVQIKMVKYFKIAK